VLKTLIIADVSTGRLLRTKWGNSYSPMTELIRKLPKPFRLQVTTFLWNLNNSVNIWRPTSMYRITSECY